MLARADVMKEMLGQIPDPKTRQMYGDILAGRVTKLVKCDSDKCKHRIIASVIEQGNSFRVVETAPKRNKKGYYKSGLGGWRIRLDGNLGFRCYCGNDSRLCEAEQGIITAATPSAEDLAEIARRLEGQTRITPDESGKLTIDGFTIENVRAV